MLDRVMTTHDCVISMNKIEIHIHDNDISFESTRPNGEAFISNGKIYIYQHDRPYGMKMR